MCYVSKIMIWITIVLFTVASVLSINRPVYKIVLTQTGYTQFLQYDVETPPLREFTFCTWIRPYNLEHDQSIFTYVANGNNRVIRLWLDSGGLYLRIAINGKMSSSAPVDVVKDVWRHVCLSYQSDYGAWALYIDSHLVSCEAAQNHYGYVLPGGGSIIIGYGTAKNGAPNGFEGEIFGANMILTSTIERNHTIKRNPLYEQKYFQKNKLKKQTKDMNYVVLSDLLTDEVHNNFEKPFVTATDNGKKSYVKFLTPYSYIEHIVGADTSTNDPQIQDMSIEKEIFDFTVPEKTYRAETNKINLWNVDSPTGSHRSFKTQIRSNSQSNPSISEIETPPLSSATSVYFDKNFNMIDEVTESFYKPNEDLNKQKTMVHTKSSKELSTIITPPPITTNSKVYGQWTSSKFAGSVLNYLKSINFQNKQQNFKRIPPTIPLNKISDTLPYASDFKLSKLQPPPQFKRKNLVEKRYDIIRRDRQINVQILKEDLRSTILRQHAQTQPKQVELANKGEPSNSKENRFYREANYQSITKFSDEEDHKPRPFMVKKKHNRYFSEPEKSANTALPFSKSSDYFSQDTTKNERHNSDDSNDLYFKSLSSPNDWHNVKTYSKDYTARQINMESNEYTLNSKDKMRSKIKYKYVPEKMRVVENADEPSIIKGRQLAIDVSNQSVIYKDPVSILKYNHGYLPNHDIAIKLEEKVEPARKNNTKRYMDPNYFEKQVKLGNSLNERHLIGNDYMKKLSFIGGDEKIPDINRYRSDIDNENEKVPPSLGPRICKNVELYDQVLYVQQDESIDMTRIVSSFKEKNIAIEFVQQNYKKCSLSESNFQRNPKLFIDWSKTPVRLFGGANPKTTTDLCGFF